MGTKCLGWVHLLALGEGGEEGLLGLRSVILENQTSKKMKTSEVRSWGPLELIEIGNTSQCVIRISME